MYDNSELTMYGGSVNYLYLYENSRASLFGFSYMNELYIDPLTTAQVKIYAYDVTFLPLNPPFEPYSEGRFHGYWISNDMPFSFSILGSGAYSKVQIIPEPATLALFGLGVLPFLRRRRL